MGVRGVRRGNTAQQIESQTKNAAAALLAVMNLLQRGEQIELSEEWASYLAAIGRRLEWIRSRTSVPAATTSPETPNNETVSDEYAEGFENGCAFTVAAFLENLGHLNYIFDGLNCCKICGLVKPAEGWKKQCKGPTGLRIDASPETPVGGEAQKCVKCGHSKASPDDGLCDELLPYVKKEPFGMEMCGCKCEFAAPVQAAVDDEGERKVYDDSQPVHAALSMLIDDGYATDKQRQTARLALALIEQYDDAVQVAINTCGDVTQLGRFSRSVDPVKWVADLQAHLAAAAVRSGEGEGK